MIIADSIKICERVLATLPPTPEEPAIVAAPTWWVNMVKAHGGAEQDEELDKFCGCKVIVKDELKEPSLVAADGRTWSILPIWARTRDAEQTN